MQEFFYFTPFVTAYEDDIGDTPSDDKGDKQPDDKVEDTKTFAQEDVDRIVQERIKRERTKYSDQISQLVSELETVKSQFNGTKEEQDALQARIEELRSKNMSVEEQANRKVKELETTLQTERDSLSNEVEFFKNMHFNYRVEKELYEAAKANDARVPDQLVALLKHNTKVKQVVGDDGKPLPGMWETKTSIKQTKEDGTEFEVELTPMEAISKLREEPNKWGNQFNSKSSPGVDLMNEGPSGGSSDGLKIDGSFEDYKKSRNTPQGKKQLGLR